jgi:Acyltransferase C-terminus
VRHVGFEGLDDFSGIIAAVGGPVHPVRVHLERVPSAEVPRDEASLTSWLDDRWLEMDAEVGGMLARR